MILVHEKPLPERPLQGRDGRFRRSGGFLTQARKNRIISLNGACDDEPEASRGTTSADGAVARRGATASPGLCERPYACCWRELRQGFAEVLRCDWSS